MIHEPPTYEFFNRLARIINSGQSRSVLLHGNVQDLFFTRRDGHDDYAPLLNFLIQRCDVEGLIIVVYELNGPIRFQNENDMRIVRKHWVAWKSDLAVDEMAVQSATDYLKQRSRDLLETEFVRLLQDAIGKPTLALEFLRQLTISSRSARPAGHPSFKDNLLILIEAADMLLPIGNGDISALDPGDRHRISIAQDWFSDPGFANGNDSIIMVAEAASLLHPRVTRIPQLLQVEIPQPDFKARDHFISWFHSQSPAQEKPDPPDGSQPDLPRLTAGLSLHALRQLLIAARHAGTPLSIRDITAKVEEFIQRQLGEDVIEFKKPSHTLNEVVGFTRLKGFIERELIPRFRSSGLDALPGAAVAGPIGGGKTFIFEAVASALDLPVLVLKNIRSMWFGQTDVIFERLRRVLEALEKIVIFVDEADTQFGGVGPEVHDTERRLTGKIQQMMSDPALRGRVIWLLMTARIHQLSPDIRRPGRVGDLIIPVLDPEGDDRIDFLRWTLEPAMGGALTSDELRSLDDLTKGYSAADFASLRSDLKARSAASPLTLSQIEEIIRDHIPPAIQQTRRYQTLQALVNCTRRSLLPNPNTTEQEREGWMREIRELENIGIH